MRVPPLGLWSFLTWVGTGGGACVPDANRHVVIPNTTTVLAPFEYGAACPILSIDLGNRVTSISTNAFFRNRLLQSVAVPNSVTFIGPAAFSSCPNLRTVTIGTGVASLPREAFQLCIRLTSVSLPDSLLNISFGAFRFCRSLQRITLPDSVRLLGASAFFGAGLRAIQIPDAVTAVGIAALEWTSLQSVTIGNAVTAIAGRAFRNNSRLSSVTFGRSVAVIQSEAFLLCPNLTRVTLPNSLRHLISAFQQSSLRAIALPNAVVSIHEAFADSLSLTSAVLGNSVTVVSVRAFYNCSRLTSVTLPNSVTAVDTQAFAFCPRLVGITLPHSIRHLGFGVFGGCTSLAATRFGNQLTWVGAAAFAGCAALTTVELGNSVSTIQERAFAHCESLRSATIPDSVVTMGDSIFINCSRLASAALSSALSEVPASTFQSCSALLSITIPVGVHTIGPQAFFRCATLTRVNFPRSLTRVEPLAFGYTDALRNISIPSSAIVAEDAFVFSGCFRFLYTGGAHLVNCTLVCPEHYVPQYSLSSRCVLNALALAREENAMASALLLTVALPLLLILLFFFVLVNKLRFGEPLWQAKRIMFSLVLHVGDFLTDFIWWAARLNSTRFKLINSDNADGIIWSCLGVLIVTTLLTVYQLVRLTLRVHLEPSTSRRMECLTFLFEDFPMLGFQTLYWLTVGFTADILSLLTIAFTCINIVAFFLYILSDRLGNKKLAECLVPNLEQTFWREQRGEQSLAQTYQNGAISLPPNAATTGTTEQNRLPRESPPHKLHGIVHINPVFAVDNGKNSHPSEGAPCTSGRTSMSNPNLQASSI